MTEKRQVSREAEDPVDSFQLYMRDVRLEPRLEPEEEELLTLLLEDGRWATVELAEPGVSPDRRRGLEERAWRGREARDQIVLANLRFVVHKAKKYVLRRGLYGLELLDLIQEGNLSLLRASEQFESGHGRFSTFVARWIRRSFDRAVTDQSRIVRLPVHVHEKLDRLGKEEQWYHGEKGRPPTPEEFARELEIDLDELAQLRSADREVTSLDQPAPSDEDEVVYGDLVEDPEAAAFVLRAEDRQWLDWILAGLDARRRRILASQFGLEMSLSEVAKQENLSRERVRQLSSEALERVRSRIRSKT